MTATIKEILSINDSICDFIKQVERGKIMPEKAEYKRGIK